MHLLWGLAGKVAFQASLWVGRTALRSCHGELLSASSLDPLQEASSPPLEAM